MFIQHKRLNIMLLTAAGILFVPLLAMQFTDQVNWTVADFMVAGALLMITSVLIELVLRKVTATKYRIALCVTLLVGLILILIELAVGLFGSPLAGQ
tara:strand:- start:1033 stop:1323 length:291 start_codon:yes stop_codon:yes gene_type:complete